MRFSREGFIDSQSDEVVIVPFFYAHLVEKLNDLCERSLL
jgi:hypothetical protein